METPAVSRLIRASADDCKVSLRFCGHDDLEMLREALRIVEREKQKTKARHIRQRIRQLEKS